MITIELPFATPSLNELMGWKHNPRTRSWKYAQYKLGVRHEIMLRVCAEDNQALGAPGRRRVRFTRYSAGELDDDNLRGGFKPLRDALKDLSIIIDDNSKWLEAHYAQVKTKRGDKRTRIEIEVIA